MKTRSTLYLRLAELNRSPTTWLIIIILVWLAISLPSLMNYPFSHADEATIGGPAVQFIQAGNFGQPIFGDILGTAQNHVAIGRIYTIVLAQIFRITGMGLAQGRMFSLFGAIISTALVFALARRLYRNAWVGILAAVIYLFSWRVLYVSHILRPDIWVVVGGLSCLHLFITARKTDRKVHFFWLGSLVAILVDVYPSAIFFLFLISVNVVLAYRHPKNWRLIISYALGGILGTSYWLIVHLLPDPQLALAQLQYFSSYYDQTEITLLTQLQHLFNFYIMVGFIGASRIGIIEVGYITVGLAGLAIRRSPADKFLLQSTLIFILGFTFLIGRLSIIHLALWMPFLSIAIAATLTGLAGWLSTHIQRPYLSPALLTLGLSAPLLIASIGGIAYISWRSQPVAYVTYAAQLRALVPRNSNVLAEGAWYFNFLDGQFTQEGALLSPGMFEQYADANTFITSIIEQRQVDAFLIDEILGIPGSKSTLLRQALLDYAATNCRLAGAVDGIYGIDWGESAPHRTEVFLCP